jgi:hypothetical protein
MPGEVFQGIAQGLFEVLACRSLQDVLLAECGGGHSMPTLCSPWTIPIERDRQFHANSAEISTT